MSATGPELSQMAREAAEAPRRAALQRERNRNALREAARRIRALDPPFAITIARGSSDHAASFAKHLFETRLGIPTVSQAPSLATLFKATSPRLKGTLALAISQSGRSPDLIETILEGLSGMPSFDNLSNQEIADIVAYIETFD